MENYKKLRNMKNGEEIHMTHVFLVSGKIIDISEQKKYGKTGYMFNNLIYNYKNRFVCSFTEVVGARLPWDKRYLTREEIIKTELS
ncbi:MAG: hypothetical protein ACOC1K_00050 [Nanoarchaeota archaeon]